MAKLSPDNAHCAFLRIQPDGIGPGRISQKFTTVYPNSRLDVSCRLTERYFNNQVWTGRAAFEVDGRRIATSDLVNTWSLWPAFSATFTVASPGEHVLSIVAVPNDDGLCDILVDDVELVCRSYGRKHLSVALK